MSTAGQDQLNIGVPEAGRPAFALLDNSTEGPTATTYKQDGRRSGSVHVCQCRPVQPLRLHTRSRHLSQQDAPAAQTAVSRQKGLSKEHRA